MINICCTILIEVYSEANQNIPTEQLIYIYLGQEK